MKTTGMLKRIKINLCLSTERMEFEETEQAYVGYDPDTFQDFGMILEKTFPNMETALLHLSQYMEKPDHAELYLDDGSETILEWSVDGEYDYNTPVKEQIPFCENYKAYIMEVYETDAKSADVQNVLYALNSKNKENKSA